jgi:hypothetical protein
MISYTTTTFSPLLALVHHHAHERDTVLAAAGEDVNLGALFE